MQQEKGTFCCHSGLLLSYRALLANELSERSCRATGNYLAKDVYGLDGQSNAGTRQAPSRRLRYTAKLSKVSMTSTSAMKFVISERKSLN